MSSDSNGKLQLLQKLLPPRGVLTQSWLDMNGIYQQLTQKYVESGWLERIGYGAFKRKDEEVAWEAGLKAVQKQLMIPLHIGAKSALEIKGSAHYIRMGKRTLQLFGYQDAPRLPKWFLEQKWEHKFEVIRTNLFPKNLEVGYTEENVGGFDLTVSSRERAAFEMLYLIPKKQGWDEANLIFETFGTFRDKQVQQLLEACTSVKVKRLFLFFAEKHSHPWFKKLNLKNVDLGSGDRNLFKNGKFNKKYRITLPPELMEGEEQVG